ncbi:PREDICTED: uncharacterized protein LOC109581143 isoform X2 [Amphimedon queenslandica]|uniref:Uncharacterized protein n=1 Tax=Amphimedon queenslandica TaxID=400682 RepID=A0AAN0J0G9_AMPQE|nr:PREDICTED: uncharacterized protein LOC109581143 isoform X2 [Amphimedon queenslandica]|eukprot:XP_019850509.1 PREDICTED: uncharacterized protein LOC109581143 isoform X2 [Amphimedon queenslandica]
MPVVLPNARKVKEEMKKGRFEATLPGKTQESKGLLMLKGLGSEEGRSTVKMASMSTLKRGVSVENDNMEQSIDTDNGGSVTTASSSFQASLPLPLPQTMEPIITADNELAKDKEAKEGGGGGGKEGERVITKNQWTTTDGLHYLTTKVVDDDRLIKVIQKGQELLHEIRMAHSHLPYSAMERQTDCFSIEKSEITQRVTKVLYTSSNDFKAKDTGTANRLSTFHQKKSKLARDGQKNKVCLYRGEADHNSASSLERYMHLTTGCPSSSIDFVPAKPVLVSSYQTTGKITYLNDDVTSIERGTIKKEQRGLPGVADSGPLREQEWVEKTEAGSTQKSCYKLDMCHIGGVTLVESNLDEQHEEVLIEERERSHGGGEEETRYEEVKKESNVCPVEEIKGNLVMRVTSPVHKGPEGSLQNTRPRLAVQVLPSVSIDPVTKKKDNNAVLSLACSSESTPSDTEKPFIPTTPHQAIRLEGKVYLPISPRTSPPPLSLPVLSNEAERTRKTHFSNDVSLDQVQQKAQSHIKGQAQEWAKHELLVQLLSSLRDSNVSLASSSSSLSHSPRQSVARESDNVANLVKEILLQEALSLYHPLEDSETKEEEEEEEEGGEGEDYSDTSFESEVITPLSTPSPTPPSSPIVIPKEATPIIHTPELTPVGSLTISPKEEEDELITPQGSPNSQSSITYDNSTVSHKSTTSHAYEVLADTSYATPTPTVISLPNDAKEKDIIVEEEKPEVPESVTDSSSFSSSSSQNNTHSKVLVTSDSSVTTDNDISVGENLRSLLGAVPPQPPTVCNDVSLSEGEVPLSPGDTRWNVFVGNRVQQTNLSTVCRVTDQYTDSMTTTEETNKESITPFQLNILTPGFPMQPSLLSFHHHPPRHAATAFISTPFNNNERSSKRGTSKEAVADIKSTNDNAIMSSGSNNNDDDTLAHVPSLSDEPHSLNNQLTPPPLSPGEVPCPHSRGKVATGSPQLSEGEVPVFTHKKSKKTREGTVVINLSRNRKSDNSNDGAQVVRVAPVKKSVSLATPSQPQWVSQSVLRSSSKSSLPRKPYDRIADPDPVFNISSRGPVMILDTDNDHNASSIDSLTLT